LRIALWRMIRREGNRFAGEITRQNVERERDLSQNRIPLLRIAL
jgi:hypothetical protein